MGFHSSLSYQTDRLSAEEEEQNASFNLVVICDKSKSQLSRVVPKKFVFSFNQIGKDVPTFTGAQTVADQIFAPGIDFDRAEIIYHKSISMAAYEVSTVTVSSADIFERRPEFSVLKLRRTC